MGKKCPKCGLNYPDSDSFCIECGGKLQKIVKIKRPVRIAVKPVKGVSGLRKAISSVSRGFGSLSSRMASTEEEMKEIEKELAKLAKIRIPVKDVQGLRESLADGVNRIELIGTRLTRTMERIRDNENSIADIKEKLAVLPRKEDIKSLRDGVRESKTSILSEHEGLLAKIETGLRSEFKTAIEDFISQFSVKLDSSVQRISNMESQLQKIAESYDKSIDKRLEKFKVDFNKKVNKDILNLRNEVGMKMGIINDMKKSLVKEMKLNKERYSRYENTIKEGTEGLENFKEGLNIQQQERIREMETQFLERLGEIKRLRTGEGDAKSDIEENARKIGELNRKLAKLSYIEGLAEAVRSRKGKRGAAKGIDALRYVQKNSRRIQTLRNRLDMMTGLEKDLADAIIRLEETESSQKERIEKLRKQEEVNKEQIKDIEKLTEDLILQQQHTLASLESRTGKAISELKGHIADDIEAGLVKRLGLNMKKANELRKRMKRIAALEKSMERNIEKNKDLGDDLVLHQQTRLADLESSIKHALKKSGILTLKTKNMNKIIKTEVKKEIREMEKRILREIR